MASAGVPGVSFNAATLATRSMSGRAVDLGPASLLPASAGPLHETNPSMATWITRPPDDDWHLLDETSPAGSLLLSACGRNFETVSRGYRLQTDPALVPERRRCPTCQGAFVRSMLP